MGLWLLTGQTKLPGLACCPDWPTSNHMHCPTPPTHLPDQVDDGSGEAGGAGGAGAGTGVNLANADAERTLLRIKQKLEGVEAGEWACLGVAHRSAGGRWCFIGTMYLMGYCCSWAGFWALWALCAAHPPACSSTPPQP